MEVVTLFFMIVSVIYMALVYLRLRDIDHNATANTDLIRHDIADHDRYISTSVSDCALQVSNMEYNLTTEIACLATKNNEDIKRMKGFQVGDVIEYAGEETLVLDRQMMTLNNKENLTDYIIWNKTQGIQQETASHLEHNAIFLRRVNLKE